MMEDTVEAYQITLWLLRFALGRIKKRRPDELLLNRIIVISVSIFDTGWTGHRYMLGVWTM